ncbi:hypothetical protein ACJMK2_027096 [Sinanodonta woodiana]|uniref:Uncharacterized protein n=1 Tax=Sinanodonta woodiana TaxID=1069815 RepID=A0ABD3XQ83_SINWO
MSLRESIQFDANEMLTCLHHCKRSLKLHYSERTSALDNINKSSKDVEEEIKIIATEMIEYVTVLRNSTLESLSKQSRDLRDSVRKKSETIKEYQRRIESCEKKLTKCGPRQHLEEAKHLLSEIDETIGKVNHGDFKPRFEFLQSKEVTKFRNECIDLGKISVVSNESQANKLCETNENVYRPSGSDISYVGVSGNMDPEVASISTDTSDYAEVSGLYTIKKDIASTANDSLFSENKITRSIARSMSVCDNYLHWQKQTVEFVLANTIQVPIMYDNCCEITSLIVLKNGDILLTDYANCCLTVYKRQDSYHIQLDDRPCSVCRSDIDDSIIVGLCTKPLLIKYVVKGGRLQEIQRISIATEGDLLCVSCHEDIIFLSCAGIKILMVSSKTNRILKTITLNDTGTLSLQCVSAIATDGQSIYASDNGKVLCIDINSSTLKWTYDAPNFDPGDLKFKDDLLYVTDWKGRSVKMLCIGCGSLLQNVVIEEDICHPRAIDISNNYIFLSQYDEKSPSKNNYILQFDMVT